MVHNLPTISSYTSGTPPHRLRLPSEERLKKKILLGHYKIITLTSHKMYTYNIELNIALVMHEEKKYIGTICTVHVYDLSGGTRK